jgi:hypothetical protein
MASWQVGDYSVSYFSGAQKAYVALIVLREVGYIPDSPDPFNQGNMARLFFARQEPPPPPPLGVGGYFFPPDLLDPMLATLRSEELIWVSDEDEDGDIAVFTGPEMVGEEET